MAVITVPMEPKKIGCRRIIIGRGKRRENEGLDKKAIITLATAHKWRDMLNAGQYKNYRDLAEGEQVHHSYVWRMLKLTYLAPSIIIDILDGRQPSSFSVTEVMKGVPLYWQEQRDLFGFK